MLTGKIVEPDEQAKSDLPGFIKRSPAAWASR
jgi:hypothetical protein